MLFKINDISLLCLAFNISDFISLRWLSNFFFVSVFISFIYVPYSISTHIMPTKAVYHSFIFSADFNSNCPYGFILFEVV